MSEIKKIYIIHALVGLTTAASITFTLYFLSFGLSQLQIAQLFSIFMIGLAILDIPTGGLADMYGHKLSVAVGMFLQGISFLLFFSMPTYEGFMLGMLASAGGLAFISGALSSLVYDLLQKENLQDDFQKVLGRANMYLLLAGVIAAPVGAFVYKFYPRAPYFFAFLCFMIANLVCLSIKSEFKKKPRSLIKYVQSLVHGIQSTLKSRILMATVIIGIALTTNRMVFNQNINQPFLVAAGIDIVYIGIIGALVSIAQAYISLHAHTISKKWGRSTSLLIIIGVPSVSVLALGFMHSLLVVPVIMMFHMGHVFRNTVLEHIVQEEVDSDMRSTMASSASFFISIVVGLLMPYGGKSIDLFGLNLTLVYLGIFTAGLGIVGFGMYKRSQVVKK